MSNQFSWYKEPFLELEQGAINLHFKDELFLIGANGKSGLIDWDGHLHVPMISEVAIKDQNIIVRKNEDGLAIHNHRLGKDLISALPRFSKFIEPNYYLFENRLVSVQGKEVQMPYPLRGVSSYAFREGAMAVELWVDTENRKCYSGYIDEQGNALTEFKYRYPDDFNGGIASVCDKDYLGYEFINKSGETVFKCPKGWRPKSFNGPLALIGMEGERGFGFMDRNFELVIPCQFSSASRTQGDNHGLYIVSKEAKTGAIDATGATKIPFEFTSVKSFNKERFIVTKQVINRTPKPMEKVSSYKSGLFDIPSQQMIIPCEYDQFYLAKAGKNYLKAMKNGKWGLLNKDGQLLVDYQFEQVSQVADGKAWVKLNNKWGVIIIQ